MKILNYVLGLNYATVELSKKEIKMLCEDFEKVSIGKELPKYNIKRDGDQTMKKVLLIIGMLSLLLLSACDDKRICDYGTKEVKDYSFTKFEFNISCDDIKDALEINCLDCIRTIKLIETQVVSEWFCSDGTFWRNYTYVKDIYFSDLDIKNYYINNCMKQWEDGNKYNL